MLNSLKDFVVRVESLDNVQDAFYVFEGECSERLVNQIYSLATVSDNEPFRAAMHRLGYTEY